MIYQNNPLLGIETSLDQLRYGPIFLAGKNPPQSGDSKKIWVSPHQGPFLRIQNHDILKGTLIGHDSDDSVIGSVFHHVFDHQQNVGKFFGGRISRFKTTSRYRFLLADVMDLLTHFDKKALPIAFSKVSPSLGRSGLVPANQISNGETWLVILPTQTMALL